MAQCGRCHSMIPAGEELGGVYGGVCCVRHRSCWTCWFEKNADYGARAQEDASTKHIPLVDKPRKDYDIQCYGCIYNLAEYKASP